jgi:hypothetical protein
LSSGETPESLAEEGVAEAVAEDAAPDELSGRRLRWLPLAIVIVSVLAAVMGWRASVAEERSNRAHELSRQGLVRQQQLQLTDLQSVNGEVRLYGRYEQLSLQAHALRREARRLPQGAGPFATEQAQRDVSLAAPLWKQISSEGLPNNLADGTYDPRNPYSLKRAREATARDDIDLASLDPEHLNQTGERARLQGVQLTGLAALFVGAIVLFTLAAVTTGSAVRWFGRSGVALAVVGVVLFLVVEVF